MTTNSVEHFKQLAADLQDIVTNPANHFPTLTVFLTDEDRAALQAAASVLYRTLAQREHNNTHSLDTTWAYHQRQEERMSSGTYKIVRFYRENRPNAVIATGLTLEEAQDHCQREDTHGDGWFDGYEAE